VAQNTGWHRWLWDIRLSQLRAEIALARDRIDEAARWAENTIALSAAKHHAKYGILGLWARARALIRSGRTHEAIADLKKGLEEATRLDDPAVLLRLETTLLAVDGNDHLLNQTRETAQRILVELPTPAMRRAFQTAPSVQSLGPFTGF
jgi:hypothetical protein